MPLPMPEKHEDSQKFISRCMGMDVMQEEYPDEKQRSAVCYKMLRKARGGKTMMTKEDK